jgi:acetylornithine deacetylase/succinyl-diaminopimelate desuccinylase-like protein
MQDIFRYIDEHQEEAIDQLIRLTGMPSVSAQGRAIRETAAVVQGMLTEAGLEAEIVSKWPGNVVVLGELAGASSKTLLFYNHYDVQPAEPLELWTSPPFEPAIRDGKIYGRGVDDNKGNLVSRLAAIRAFVAVRGQVPVNIKFCIEGDEEIGSPGIESFLEKQAGRLAADACIWEGGGVNWQDQLQITLGVKGSIYVELVARGASRDAHSQYATVVPNAAWRLVWALSTLKDADDNILLEGFYDNVRPVLALERAALEAMPSLEEHTAESLGLTGFVKGVRGLEYRLRHILEPTCNIDGLSAGDPAGGRKTVIPCQAVAHMDFRLVPDQTPDEILDKLRRHLESRGFGDIEVRRLSSAWPARTPIDDPFVQVVREAGRRVYPAEPLVVPTMAGTGPLYPFIKTLGLPTADCGVGYPESRIHAPDENIRLADFVRGAKHVAAILEEFAGS